MADASAGVYSSGCSRHKGGHGHGAAGGAGAGHRRMRGGHAPMDFDKAPFVVIWETTQSCDLACKHCRAQAQPLRHPDELTTDEAKAMMKRLREFGPVVFVFSGGDCMKRPDIVELVKYGADLGMRMAATPATTPLTSKEKLRELKEAGLVRLAVSLDGSNAGIHDTFRRVEGSFDHGLRILRQAREVGMSTQVNTVVRRDNINDMRAMAELNAQLGIVFWEVFFLVPMGRARPEDVASAAEFERVFDLMYEMSKEVPYDIKATAAPQYSRVVVQHKRAENAAVPRVANAGPIQIDVLTSGKHHSDSDGIGRARNVNDGDGFLFISHTGDVFPSGFLPVKAGNVRDADVIDIYQRSELFRGLRDRSKLKGKCGVCNYKGMCGGSRARAFAVTGDPFESEPFCAYVPPRWEKMVGDG
ncbi:TIGR04053 family radical SAM/SPASM domain-containing protein [Dermatophilus congolensis]|uniref:Pyrroloquinoline quinone biosynthesis protein PqqE n=1 Tax=Dermatophilus congolensis TaxID=1863 RepID=A0A239V412_9MICO|nr:TIGR04053 family radical SAM/SPASM domain-containing protein [Dermatophilus congolensis]SNV16975.1 pyrroloquinoline quinone biosynthesis protein PqqE [Dermatophilus congolensis]